MWEPVGPLPAAVYWRRRCTAALPRSAVLGLLTWIRRQPRRPGPGTPPPARPAAPQSPLPSPPPRPRRQPATPASTPGAGAPRAGRGSAPDRRADRGTARRPARRDGRAAAARRLAALRRGPPRRRSRCRPPARCPCSDDMIGVAAEIDSARAPGRPATDAAAGRDQHQRAAVRARPRLGAPGDRGLEPGRADRLWSSNDCVNGSTADLRTLVPGQPVAFAVAWAGRTSAPGCAGSRSVRAGRQLPGDEPGGRRDQRRHRRSSGCPDRREKSR